MAVIVVQVPRLGGDVDKRKDDHVRHEVGEGVYGIGNHRATISQETRQELENEQCDVDYRADQCDANYFPFACFCI